MWVMLFNLLLQMALGVLRQVESRKQMEEARVKAALELLRKADEMVNNVDAVVAGVSHDSASILHDRANRDQLDGGSGAGDSKGGVQDGVRSELQRDAGHTPDGGGNPRT